MRAEEIVLKVPDGRSVTVLVNATFIHTEAGEVESLVVTLQDLTPLEELERLRAELLGMVSHELRLPLTSIRGSATALLDAAPDLDPAEMRQFHRIILDQADAMRELIGDLLDVARIETGTLPVSPEPVEIADLVDRARNTFLNGGSRNHLDIDLAPDLPLVRVDRRRIVQVLDNLLSNAARHSPGATVTQAGYASTVTADPEEALLLMRENRPHLVLLDLVLPGTDGIELMRDLVRIAEIPVIFLSGYGKDEVIAQAFEAGAADYLVKPFAPTELVARVRARPAPAGGGGVGPSRPNRMCSAT